MSNKDIDIFLNLHLPRTGYNTLLYGQIELYTEKGLSFTCKCGSTHPVASAFAVIDFPLENKGLYVCPYDKNIFVLVKATGLFSIKGLKTIASIKAENEVEVNQIMSNIESRKKRN